MPTVDVKEKKRLYMQQYRKTDAWKIYQYSYNRLPEVKDKSRISKSKYQTDINFRVNMSMSSNVRQSMKGNKCGRHWETLVGYTLEDLRIHLENLFEHWMNWDNYGNQEGQWSIDHIVPVSSFKNLATDENEFKICWALKNLRPLRHIENISKGNKLIMENANA